MTDMYSIYKYYHMIRYLQDDIVDDFKQPPNVVPILLPYQRKTVKWLIDRETSIDLVKNDNSPFTGGIFAEEVYMGKIIEMLCCIIANPAPLTFCNETIVSENVVNILKRKQLYCNDKNKATFLNADNPHVISCVCGQNQSEKAIVNCMFCGIGQHAECIRFEQKSIKKLPFLCSYCWYYNDKLFQCKATLIVMPQYSLNQWLNEIEKYIKNPSLKVFVYEGLSFEGFIQPYFFNDYDIVITSYNNIYRDAFFSIFQMSNNYKFFTFDDSREKYYLCSPLSRIRWWRICLDDSHTLTNTCYKLIDFHFFLKSKHKWVITPTPIKNSVLDFYDILRFLEVSPYCNYNNFIELINSDLMVLFHWLSKLIRRNLIEIVYQELNIPPIRMVENYTVLSPIETLYYEYNHEKLSIPFYNLYEKKYRNYPLPFGEKEQSEILSIAVPIINKLQHICVYPNDLRGNYLNKNISMTWTEFINYMIKSCQTRCNELLKNIMQLHNEISEILRKKSNVNDAILHYKTVLDLSKRFSGKLNVCEIQVMHASYKLKSLISKQEVKILFNNELFLENNIKSIFQSKNDSYKNEIQIIDKYIEFYSIEVTKIISEKLYNCCSCMFSLLKNMSSLNKFLAKVEIELDNYYVPFEENCTTLFFCMNDILNYLNRWQLNLNLKRKKIILSLNKLRTTYLNNSERVVCFCHIVHGDTSFHKIKSINCMICNTKQLLNEYGSLLFSSSYFKNNILIDVLKNYPVIDDESLSAYENNDVNFWEVSQQEFLLTKVFEHEQIKINDQELLKSTINSLMKYFTLIRKEFKYLQILWVHIHFRTKFYCHIFLSTFNLKYNGFTFDPDFSIVGLSKKKIYKKIITEKSLNLLLKRLSSKIKSNTNAFEKSLKKLHYFENLKKENENSIEIQYCPICHLNSNHGWAVSKCGHYLCDKCLIKLLVYSFDQYIICPICRYKTFIEHIIFVHNDQQDPENECIVKGYFPAKVMKITMELVSLNDSNEKVLIYSTSTKCLDLLGKALDYNGINYRMLKCGHTFERTIKDFKTDPNIRTLLLPIIISSTVEMDLTEASKIYFMEPLYDLVDEAQAIKPVLRNGQTKNIYLYKFIAHNTIEGFISRTKTNYNNMTLIQWENAFYKTYYESE